MDYRKYSMTLTDELKCFAAAAAGSVVLAWLFYKSVYGMVLFVPLFVILRKRYAKTQCKKRQQELLLQFRDGMQAVSAALLAGYSMENAWREAEAEVQTMHGDRAYMALEFGRMNEAIRMNQPLESGLQEFAGRSGCEDIESFAEVFSFAKRGGGDFAGIIRNTVERMNGKIEVEQEIATAVSGKKLEGKIMNLMPVFILCYLNLTSGDFLNGLYGNILGIGVMTAALLAYGGAIRLSERIMDICI
jgi:tight adherence protein B